VTRLHEDVDLVVELEAISEVLAAVGELGYSVSEDLAPVRMVLGGPEDLRADLHPVTFSEDGTGWQLGAAADGSDCPYPPSGSVEGRILDHRVPCISAELQLEHHCGYEPRDRDWSDMARLAKRFGLTARRAYRWE